MEKSIIIKTIHDRLDAIEKWKAEKVEKGKKRSKTPPSEDEDVCPKCGGDLLFVEEGIVFCSKCQEYYEAGEEE